jgi:hypothetical protein
MFGQDAAKSLGRGEAEEFDNAVDRTFARRGTTDIMHREQILQEALCAVRAGISEFSERILPSLRMKVDGINQRSAHIKDDGLQHFELRKPFVQSDCA